MNIVEEFVKSVQTLLKKNPKKFPPELFTDAKYITGNDRECHASVIKLLKLSAEALSTVAKVTGEDKSIHKSPLHGGWKPDLGLWDSSERPICFVEYESLNSSDERVLEKDVWKYQKWAEDINGTPAPLLIITTLRNGQHLAYPARVYNYPYNREHKGNLAKIRENPFEYWYSVYRSKIVPEVARLPIAFANFDENKFNAVKIDLNAEALANARKPAMPITDHEWDSTWWKGGEGCHPSQAVIRIRAKFKEKLRDKSDVHGLRAILCEFWEEEQIAWKDNEWSSQAKKGFLKDVERIRHWQDAVRVIVNLQSMKY